MAPSAPSPTTSTPGPERASAPSAPSPAAPSPAALDPLAGVQDLPVEKQIERYETLLRELTTKLQANES